MNNQRVAGHRWLYMHLVGAIPDGHQMHHECRVPPCVRPGHLTPLTPDHHRQVTAVTSFVTQELPFGTVVGPDVSHSERERAFGQKYELPIGPQPSYPYVHAVHLV